MEWDKIRSIVAEELQIRAEEIHMDSRFSEDLGADSLNVYRIITEIEDVFSVEVSDAFSDYNPPGGAYACNFRTPRIAVTFLEMPEKIYGCISDKIRRLICSSSSTGPFTVNSRPLKMRNRSSVKF